MPPESVQPTEPSGVTESAASFTERFRNLVPACPVCFGEMSTSCHFTYNTYRCWSCGVTIDGRAGRPLSMLRAEAAAEHEAWERGENAT